MNIGDMFGFLTVVRKVPNRKGYWVMLCGACGRTKEMAMAGFKYGNARSCGCMANQFIRESLSTHKGCNNRKITPEYNSWQMMRARCNNPNAEGYENYGGRGIQVCDRWSDFQLFLQDMGQRPKGTTLDRRNNDGNYEPLNCRWATRKEQAINRRPRGSKRVVV